MANKRSGGDGQLSPAWVATAMSRDYALAAKVDIEGDASSIPDSYGGIRLTTVGHQFLAWWLEARRGAAMPSAEAVSPRALRQLLPYIRYMSWEGPECMVYRIFGSALAEGTGVDLTGSDLYGAEYHGRATDIARMKMLHRAPCGGIMIRELPGQNGGKYPCELLTLPIAPGADGKLRTIGTVMPTEIDENVWTKKIRLDTELRLLRSVFIDIGYGVPDPALGLSA